MTHPLGSAVLLIVDTLIPYDERELDFKILILHNVLEDTLLALPGWVEADVRNRVGEMTYSGPNTLEEKKGWVKNKNSSIKLLMLYDYFWSLYEQHVPGSIKRQNAWTNGVTALADEAEKQYDNICIVQIARDVAQNTTW